MERTCTMSLYDRADIYDLRFNQQGWDIFQAHYQELFDGTGIKTVLDCSIGSGNLTLELAELGYQVTGSDLSDTMLSKCLEKAKKRGLAVELFRSDFREVDRAAAGKYDCVMSTGNSLPYVSNADVLRTLAAMDRLVNPGGYLYVDTRNWDMILDEKQQYYFYRPMFHDGLRVDTIQFWEHHSDGTITFHIVFTLERDGKVLQREVFRELYHPLRRAVLEGALRDMGYTVQRIGPHPIQAPFPAERSEWYCVLAQKL